MHEEATGLKGLTPEEQERLAGRLMRRQAGLGLRVAAVFLLLLFGLPLVNLYAPDFANARVGGFTLTWLFLGALFFPVTWVLAAYYVRATERIERESAEEFRRP